MKRDAADRQTEKRFPFTGFYLKQTKRKPKKKNKTAHTATQSDTASFSKHKLTWSSVVRTKLQQRRIRRERMWTVNVLT